MYIFSLVLLQEVVRGYVCVWEGGGGGHWVEEVVEKEVVGAGGGGESAGYVGEKMEGGKVKGRSVVRR